MAAFEVPLPSTEERSEFLTLLRREANAEGLHVDAEGKDELKRVSKDIPEAAMTIHATVWRGRNDDQAEAIIMDQVDHLGRVWITFTRGRDPDLARRFRDRARRKIVDRWPYTKTLPIMPTGAIPLPADLRLMPKGYLVKPDAASKYGLTARSSLVAPP